MGAENYPPPPPTHPRPSPLPQQKTDPGQERSCRQVRGSCSDLWANSRCLFSSGKISHVTQAERRWHGARPLPPPSLRDPLPTGAHLTLPASARRPRPHPEPPLFLWKTLTHRSPVPVELPACLFGAGEAVWTLALSWGWMIVRV